MDTPEEAGIDLANLKENLSLLQVAIDLSKKTEADQARSHQVILTTGLGKYPAEFEEFVKLRFNKEDGNFILKERNKHKLST